MGNYYLRSMMATAAEQNKLQMTEYAKEQKSFCYPLKALFPEQYKCVLSPGAVCVLRAAKPDPVAT